jgi:SAM-dependent methyltransferase
LTNIYTSGKYLEETKTWHTEDSAWKANQIIKIISDNKIYPKQIGEVGCGGGMILKELSEKILLKDVQFNGYDISPQAIELSRQIENARIKFFLQDLCSETNTDQFDILLAIDVFEHVPDYMGFLSKCRTKAEYKIYHVPLDLNVSSVFKNTFMNSRQKVGHLHYFTADSALATLRDTGHEIVDYFYPNWSTGVYDQPSLKRSIANMPRWLISKLSIPFAARLLGGYSLLVLTK